MTRPPRSDHADGVLIAISQFTPNVEDDRRRVNFAELPRISRRFRGDDLRRRSRGCVPVPTRDRRSFPIDDLVGDFSAYSFDFAQTRAASPREFARGVSNTSSSFRSRTGPIVGSMLSAMQASVLFMQARFRNQ